MISKEPRLCTLNRARFQNLRRAILDEYAGAFSSPHAHSHTHSRTHTHTSLQEGWIRLRSASERLWCLSVSHDRRLRRCTTSAGTRHVEMNGSVCKNRFARKCVACLSVSVAREIEASSPPPSGTRTSHAFLSDFAARNGPTGPWPALAAPWLARFAQAAALGVVSETGLMCNARPRTVEAKCGGRARN